MDTMYTDHRVISERTIDSHIKKLRKKLDELPFNEKPIHSIYGAGYINGGLEKNSPLFQTRCKYIPIRSSAGVLPAKV